MVVSSNINLKLTQNEFDVSAMIRSGGRKFLSKLKQKSIRNNNSWFRTLTPDKRRFIDAVIQTLEKIRSTLLLKLLTALAQKLLKAMGGIRGLIGSLAYDKITFGQPLAHRLSKIAAAWGNSLAAKWANEEGFITYLTIIEMNNLSMFKVGKKQ